jgi:cell division protein FtsZ
VMSEMGMAMMGSGSARGENRAREAAEKAIRSPLLDDIDLQGARGILVNITAGPDLNLGEYSEVGDTVHDFASEDATVVVGTVIDPELGDELRVTVVATGLGLSEAHKPKKVVDNTRAEVHSSPADRLSGDYSGLEVPTVIRTRRRDSAAVAVAPSAEDLQYLDIPAFLRRQAD